MKSQYLPNWEWHLKAFVDTHPTVQCVASGSAAAALRLKSAESGRDDSPTFFCRHSPSMSILTCGAMADW